MAAACYHALRGQAIAVTDGEATSTAAAAAAVALQWLWAWLAVEGLDESTAWVNLANVAEAVLVGEELTL